MIPEFDVLALEMDAASMPAVADVAVDSNRRELEHPLDFEWRFARQGVSRILKELAGFRLAQDSEVLCLGCPSVYSSGKDNLPKLRFRLWDKNIQLSAPLSDDADLNRNDIRLAQTPFPSASAVVIDPPWYRSFYELFIWAATHSLPIGGYLILSFPPEGTRPTIAAERQALIAWCLIRGLRLEKFERGCLPYRSPLFEVNALRAQGVTHFPLNWRRGDLIIFEKEECKPFSKPNCTSTGEGWKEIRIGESRIKVHRERKIPGPLFKTVGLTEISPSVSSNHSHRQKANVVTSGNRYIQTNNPAKIIDLFAAITEASKRRKNGDLVRSRNSLIMGKIIDLISQEEKEAAHYFRRIHEI